MKELCISLNSASRKDKLGPVNGCVIDLPEMATNQVMSVSLGGMELPLSQNTIETDWQNIYFHHGISFKNDADRRLIYSDEGSQEVVLPMLTNKVVSVSGPGITDLVGSSGPDDAVVGNENRQLVYGADGLCQNPEEFLVGNTQTAMETYTFETEESHGLSRAGQQKITLIAFGSKDYVLSNVIVTGEKTFTAQMEAVTIAIPTSLPFVGELLVDPYKTLQSLLDAMPELGLTMKKGMLTSQKVVSAETNLAKKLGFTISGKATYLFNSFFANAKLDCGNYNASSMTTAMILSLCPTRLSLAASESNGSLDMEVTSPNGNVTSITITTNNVSISSICSPESIASVIQNLLNSNGTQALTQLSGDYSVTIEEKQSELQTHSATGKYIRYCVTNESPFEIKFSPGLARILNMRTINANGNTYRGDYIWVPVDHEGNYYKTLWNAFAQSSVAYDSHLELTQRRKSMFRVTQFSEDATEYYLTTGTFDQDTGVLTGYIHELSANDVIYIGNQRFKVDRVSSNLAFYVKKTSATLDFSQVTWKPVFFEKVSTEFDFTNRHFEMNNNPVAEILGFPETMILYDDAYVRGSYSMAIDHPPYVLLDIQFDNKSQTTVDSYKNSEKTIFAKLQTITSGNYSRELRVYAMNSTFLSPRDVRTIKVNVYNPNHSLYNFHGKNFSMTLNLAAPFLGSAQTQST